MTRDTLIKVLNRDNGSVVYSLPELNGLRRVFQAGETKEITFEEIEKLSYIPGGKALLTDSLVILNNQEAIDLILGHVEPEYSYSKSDIIKLLQQGSLEEFLDCLDFAPEGVIDLIQTLSVELPLNDVLKREAILNKTGFNVDNALRIKREVEEPETTQTPTVTRRVVKNEDKPIVSRRVVK